MFFLKTTKPEDQIRQAIEILKKTGFDKKIKIAFDEWNLRNWHHPGHGQHLKGMDVNARDKNDNNSIYTMADAKTCLIRLENLAQLHMKVIGY